MNWRAARLPEGTVWRKVQDLLHRMGGEEHWAKGRTFVPWLQNEVLPLLRFVVRGEAIANDAELDEAHERYIESLVRFEEMPPRIQATIEDALESVSPENKDRLRSLVLYDPTPLDRQYKVLAA